MRWGAVLTLGIVTGASLSCLISPTDVCHERMLAQHGCCPFHGEEECNVSVEAVRAACGDADTDHDVMLLDENAEAGESEGASDPEPE